MKATLLVYIIAGIGAFGGWYLNESRVRQPDPEFVALKKKLFEVYRCKVVAEKKLKDLDWPPKPPKKEEK